MDSGYLYKNCVFRYFGQHYGLVEDDFDTLKQRVAVCFFFFEPRSEYGHVPASVRELCVVCYVLFVVCCLLLYDVCWMLFVGCCVLCVVCCSVSVPGDGWMGPN